MLNYYNLFAIGINLSYFRGCPLKRHYCSVFTILANSQEIEAFALCVSVGKLGNFLLTTRQ